MAIKRAFLFFLMAALTAGGLSAQWRDDVNRLFSRGRNYKTVAEAVLPAYDTLEAADKPDAAALLAFCYGRQSDIPNETRWIFEYFEIEKKVDPRLKEYTQDLKEIFSGVSPRTRLFIRADRFIQNYNNYLEEELVTWIAGADRRDIRRYLRELQTICALNNLRVHPDRATEKLVELVIVSTYHVLTRLQRIH